MKAKVPPKRTQEFIQYAILNVLEEMLDSFARALSQAGWLGGQ